MLKKFNNMEQKDEKKRHRTFTVLIEKWKTLCKKISARWDNVSSIEEIRQQREKSW